MFANLCVDRRSLGKAQLLQFMNIGVKGVGWAMGNWDPVRGNSRRGGALMGLVAAAYRLFVGISKNIAPLTQHYYEHLNV